MKTRPLLLLIFIFSLSVSSYGQSDFENNFLTGYLSFENFFLQMSGDYGTTFFPFLNSGYGGREQALSGAFTAVANDISTLESNPAGTASLSHTELFFSYNKLMGDVNYNTLAYTMRFNDLAFGIGTRILYIPFTHYDNYGFDVGNGIISYSVITMNAAYNFLRSYRFFGLSVGGNVKLYIYHVPETIAENQTRVNVAFDLGILTRFNFLKAYHKPEKNFSVGLAVKNLGPFTDNEPPPTTVSVGFSYKPIERITISVDFNYLINYSTMTYLNWSVNSGFEIYFTKYTSFVAGFMIKSNPSFSIGVNLNFEDFTVTAIYNPDFSDVSKFSISASLKLGDLGREKKRVMVKKMFANALEFYNESEYEAAIEMLNKVLEKEPRHEPAREKLKEIEKTQKLLQQYNQLIDNEDSLY